MSRKLKIFLRWKKRVLLLATLGVIEVTGASYAFNEASVQVNGSVSYACSVDAQSFKNINHTIPDLINTNGTVKNYSVQFDLGVASCNYSSTLTLSSDQGRLQKVNSHGTIPNGFADAVPYAATLSWGPGTPVPMVTVGQQFVASISESSAKSDSIKIDFDITGSNTKLVEGFYTDILKIRLQSIL